jgi:hypothetical protein
VDGKAKSFKTGVYLVEHCKTQKEAAAKITEGFEEKRGEVFP